MTTSALTVRHCSGALCVCHLPTVRSRIYPPRNQQPTEGKHTSSAEPDTKSASVTTLRKGLETAGTLPLLDVEDGERVLELPAERGAWVLLELRGFEAGGLVAMRRIGHG